MDEATTPRAAPAIRASSLVGRPPPRQWHVPGWIPANTVTLLAGDGGTGKSTLALQLAIATATGGSWLGEAVREGPVFYLAAEDDCDELWRRLDEITTGLGIKMSDLDHLHLKPLADDNALLAIEGNNGQVEHTPLWSSVWNEVRKIQPTLIVFDSLADVFGGNENVRSQVREFVGMKRRLALEVGGAVVSIAHPSLSGISSGSGTSGSTAWNNSVRSRLYFTESRDPDIRLLSHMKANYGRRQSDIRLRREAGGFALLSGGGALTDIAKAAEERRVEALFLELLDAFTADGRRISDSTGRNFAPHLFAQDPRAKGVTKQGLGLAMGRLFARRSIRVETVGTGSHSFRRLARTEENG